MLHKTVSLEGFIGDGLTTDGTQLLYGGGSRHLPGAELARVPVRRPLGRRSQRLPERAASFVLKREDLYLARAGGGILLALRNRILVRIEATNLSLFNAQSYKNAQTYSGGLGVYF